MIERRAAFDWYRAEQAGDPRKLRPMCELTDGDVLSIALPRVRAVFAGEVKWSEASAGDRAIWRGRPRDAHSYGAYQIVWGNFYDTVLFTEELTTQPEAARGVWSLFGVRNIRNWPLCNLEVAGQIPCYGGGAFMVKQMYADLSRDLVLHDHIAVSLMIGARRIGSFYQLRDVARSIPVGHEIRERENFAVRLDVHNLTAPLGVTIHIEGTLKQGIR